MTFIRHGVVTSISFRGLATDCGRRSRNLTSWYSPRPEVRLQHTLDSCYCSVTRASASL
ncbi:hypothetical protein ACFPRL_32395 [Pseudoclavibacter helvolus]